MKKRGSSGTRKAEKNGQIVDKKRASERKTWKEGMRTKAKKKDIKHMEKKRETMRRSAVVRRRKTQHERGEEEASNKGTTRQYDCNQSKSKYLRISLKKLYTIDIL